MRNLALFASVVTILNSCSSFTCTTNETRTCAGPGACEGEQTCNSDGSGWGACACASTGGSSNSGQSSATGGSTGNNNASSTGGLPTATGGAPDECSGSIDPIPDGNLTVSNTGYVSVGDLEGFAYTWAWSNNLSSKSPCIEAIFGSSAVCAVGLVDADPTYSESAGLGFGVAGGVAADAAIDGLPVPNGITITAQFLDKKNGNSSVYVYIYDTRNVAYCVEPGNWKSGTEIPIRSFNTSCWNDTGEPATASLAIQKIELHISANNTEQNPFALCITNVTVQ